MHWPQSALVLRTPRLELRPDDDGGLAELVEVAYRGVHPPERMPFMIPWTDADPRYLGRGALQHFWRERARFAPESWALNFLVRSEGRVIGVQTLRADEFAVRRETGSGSWLGLSAQGRGFGTEMRAAILSYAFDVLGAEHARSEAFSDNAASLAVSARLGYAEDGFEILSPRGKPVRNIRLRLTPETFRRPDWTVQVEGHTPDLAGLLGA
ncbi:GNAT family N-acetyltransferase [Pseudonocardia pini]|uniref:GNAT family N-acetyltransferase n=1 Tax=Pseudonocardia pini TaxID=2758030 RepID=UPI0015F0DC1C|nr:GNAT family protein [Pseudonocardia pini]